MNEICTTACVFWTVLLFSSIALATSTGPNTTPDHDVAVTNVSVPSSCDRGDTVPVKVSVANQGAHREAFRVILTDQTGGKQIASKEVILAKGWKDGSEDVADVVFDSEETGIQNFGDGIQSVGDINGDGCDDILICAPYWNSIRGRVYFFYGSDEINPTSPDMVFSGEEPNEALGGYAGTFGSDVNKDGYSDIILGAKGYHDNDGRVYMYFGGPTMDTQADIIFNGEADKKSSFGFTVSAGDINNDGYEDILVGAQGYDDWRGRVYLFWGGKAMDTAADVIFEGEPFPGNEPVLDTKTGWLLQGMFGRKIAASGDVNGDGYNDILVGARYAPDRNFNGCAYLFFGNTKEEMDGACDCVFTGEDAHDQMGSSLDLFDINNDNFADVIIGARYAADYRGCVYVYWGGHNFDASSPDLILVGKPRSHIGGDDIVCGHFNNDEYGDILAGAMGYPDPYNATNRMGCAYMFNGNTRDSMDQLADHIFKGESMHSGRFGTGLSSGDFNNDHFDDVVIGAWGYDNRQGRAYLYYGPFDTSTDITFTWNTTKTSIGRHKIKVEISSVEGEKDTADNIYTTIVNIKAP